MPVASHGDAAFRRKQQSQTRYARQVTATPSWAQDVLRQQVAMNPQTWAALQEHGVDESSELRLDFFYVAPGQGEAEALGQFLKRETDYDVDVHSS
jgi:hypothetical protein